MHHSYSPIQVWFWLETKFIFPPVALFCASFRTKFWAQARRLWSERQRPTNLHFSLRKSIWKRKFWQKPDYIGEVFFFLLWTVCSCHTFNICSFQTRPNQSLPELGEHLDIRCEFQNLWSLFWEELRSSSSTASWWGVVSVRASARL